MWFFIDRFLEVHLYKPSRSNIGWWSVNNLSFTEETLIMIEIVLFNFIASFEAEKKKKKEESNEIAYSPKIILFS